MFRSFSYDNQTNLRGEANVTFNLICIKSKTKYLTCIKLAHFLIRSNVRFAKLKLSKNQPTRIASNLLLLSESQNFRKRIKKDPVCNKKVRDKTVS